jgi:hypothetical protein
MMADLMQMNTILQFYKSAASDIVCRFFNDANSNSEYIASNHWITVKNESERI